MNDPDAHYIGNLERIKLPDSPSSVASQSTANTRNNYYKAYRQLDPNILLPSYSIEVKYMPKIVAQIKMQQEISAKINHEELYLGTLRNLLCQKQ